MKLLTALGVLIISAQAQAFMPKFDQKVATKEVAKTQSADAKCTDFTGTWKGECVDQSGKKEDVTTYVYQSGCEYLFVDGAFIAIGGTRSEAHAIPLDGGDLATGATTNLTWNEDKDALAFFTKAAVYKTGIGYIYADSINGAVYMKNGKLVSYAKGKTSGAACTYSKAK